jgi:hypothetical protein
VFRGTTCFRWTSRADGSLTGPPLQRTGPGGEDENGLRVENGLKPEGKAKEDESCITGWADIGVGVDPPGIFASLPRSVAESVGDAVGAVYKLNPVDPWLARTWFQPLYLKCEE